jgi:hypothetical protein
METLAAPNPADILPKATYYQVVHTLRGLLPKPIADTPEDEARRDLAAIAHVASLLPANAEEAHLAAQYVAASAWALDCLRLARQYPGDTPHFLKCTAMCVSMMRQARAWRRALMDAQTTRKARDAAAATQTEHRALGHMAEVLADPKPAAPSKPSAIDEAERYALQHRRRARLIRRFGRVPDRLDFGPIPPDVVHAIATGDTPILRALQDNQRRSAA